MADAQSSSETTRSETDREAPPGMPRWGKVFGIVAAAALILAFVLMHIIGGGMGHH
ncbi:hypothetical protein ACIBU0_33495 [Streptomyces sp. NPDC049627]|uniref:hypothetical protein n=1 Tax=Streptomyces sp. NPDC049627 TaxID=3365595 RepID=UPI0037A8754B